MENQRGFRPGSVFSYQSVKPSDEQEQEQTRGSVSAIRHRFIRYSDKVQFWQLSSVDEPLNLKLHYSVPGPPCLWAIESVVIKSTIAS
ncbi:hypothetical protein F2P81_016104 [Scophthalmus maximus]|uniref:Uncharacterized protein n=1 Tax=Scophthalmus maximus TaxID=52904 RepID=A0A6A4SGC8_SCOMX|nr:hypothetical protein F2P81_016104 [Scophthalmus maximus]